MDRSHRLPEGASEEREEKVKTTVGRWLEVERDGPGNLRIVVVGALQRQGEAFRNSRMEIEIERADVADFLVALATCATDDEQGALLVALNAHAD